MKKCLIVILSIFAIVACDNYEENEFTPSLIEENVAIEDSFYVPYETALMYATQALEVDGDETRGVKSVRNVASHYEYTIGNSTRAAAENKEVKFHIINFENNEGFAIIAADSRTVPVYAFSLEGNIDMNRTIDNPGFKYFLESAVEYYEKDLNIDFPPLIPDTSDIPFLALEEIDGKLCHMRREISYITNPLGVLLNVNWNQDFPYNYYCGENSHTGIQYGYRNAAGCGPIAASQIMSYYRHPSSFDGYTIEWDAIMSSAYYNERYSENTECSYNAKCLARLINLVGIESYANYGSQTGVYIDDVDDMFRTFGYNCSDPTAFSSSLVRASINEGEPVFAGGISQNGGGHAWVIDGYKQQIVNVTYYYRTPPYNIYKKNVEYGAYYYHCNWGWGEDSNSNVWCLDVFSPYAGTNYNTNNQIIYNIKPIN